jgi:hypothetical protein
LICKAIETKNDNAKRIAMATDRKPSEWPGRCWPFWFLFIASLL